MGISWISIPELETSSEIGWISYPGIGSFLSSGIDWFSISELVRGKVCFFGSGLWAKVFFDWPFSPYKVNSALRNTVWDPELRWNRF